MRPGFVSNAAAVFFDVNPRGEGVILMSEMRKKGEKRPKWVNEVNHAENVEHAEFIKITKPDKNLKNWD